MEPNSYVVHIEAGPEDRAWREAVRRTCLLGGTLHAIAVVPRVFGVNPLSPRAHRVDVERSLAIRHGAYARLCRLAESVAATVHVEVAVVEGDPGSELARAAAQRGAELIILGDATVEAAPLGSVVSRVMQHAQCAVLIVREAPRSGVIVGGTDLSDATLPVVTTTCAEAARSHGRAIVAYSLEAVQTMSWLTEEARARAGRVTRDAEADASARLQRALEKYPLAEPMIIDRPVGPALVAAAARVSADLLVVGTTRRASLSRFMLGSVAAHTMRYAPCSVLAVQVHR